MPTYKKQIRKTKQNKIQTSQCCFAILSLNALKALLLLRTSLSQIQSNDLKGKSPEDLKRPLTKQPHIEYHLHHKCKQINKIYKKKNEYAQHGGTKTKNNA